MDIIEMLYFIGVALKSAQAFADKHIPLALGAVGVALAALWVVATSAVTCPQECAMAVFTAIVQGVLVAGASVYINQLIKQAQK